MARIKTGIKDISTSELILKSIHIIWMMTNNPNFPNPNPSIAEVQAALDAFRKATVDALNRDKLKIIIRREKEDEMRRLITALSAYVKSVSQGDKQMIVSSGFDLAKTGKKRGKLPPPGNFRVSFMEGFPGSLKLRWKGVPGAKGYVIHTTTDIPNADSDPFWRPVGFTTRSSHIVTDLEIAIYHTFRITPVNSAGFGAPSQPVTSIAP